MSLAVIIPARTGSKRIPHKNFRDFLGVPIISRVCSAVLNSACADHIYVSSDSPDLSFLPHEVTHLRRSESLSDDHATIRDVMCGVIQQIEEAGSHYHSYMLVYATAVLVDPCHFAQAAERHAHFRHKFLLSVTDYGHPIQRAFALDADNALCLAQDFSSRQRTQDFEQYFHDAAAFCLGTRAIWMGDQPIIGTETIGYPLERTACWDIDTESDWLISEAIYSAKPV